jgi:RNase P/RNase MRP subunit POP5
MLEGINPEHEIRNKPVVTTKGTKKKRTTENTKRTPGTMKSAKQKTGTTNNKKDYLITL